MKYMHEIYQSILDSGTWKYYHNSKCPYSVDELFLREQNALEWVKSIFRDGEKLCVFNGFHNESILFGRMKHTVSVFLLGIYIASVNNKLKKQLEKFVNKQGITWKYFWFITCLYHDYGYIVENDKELYPVSLNITQLTEILHIDSAILDNLTYDNLNISAHEIHAYYDYNRNMEKKPFINHGIVGGISLYCELKRNLDEIIQEQKRIKDNFDETNFMHNGLHYSNSHEKWYKLCAESIILHNIWCAQTKKDKNTYKKNNLKRLCRTNKLWYNNPITNLLILADTLEPYKKIGADSLSSIQIACLDNNTTKITIPTYLLQGDNGDEFLDSIISLKDWFNVKSRKYTGKKNFSYTFQIN